MSLKKSASFGAIAFAILCAPATVLMPILVGAYVDWLGMTAAAAGNVAAFELAGVAGGGFLVAAWVGRPSAWMIPFATAGAVVVANFATAALEGDALIATRLVAGLGAGGSVSFMASILARAGRPDRDFAIFFFVYLLIASALFQSASLLSQIARGGGPFYGLAALAAVALVVVALSPAGRGSPVGERPAARSDEVVRPPLPNKIDLAVAMTLLFLFFAACGGVWVFAERIALEQGYGSSAARSILGASTLAGALGAAAAAAVKRSRRRGIAFGFAALLVSATSIGLGKTAVPLPASFVAFVFAWMFLTPVLMAGVAALDPVGRASALAAAVQNVGQATGPALAAIVFGADRLSGVGWGAALLLVPTLLLALLLESRIRRVRARDKG